LRVITIESYSGNDEEFYLTDGEGPSAAMIHMDVIYSLFSIARNNVELADSIGEMIIKAARAIEAHEFVKG